MNKRKKIKLIVGILILVSWTILLAGIIKPPIIVWVTLIVITIIFYFGITRKSYRQKGNIEDVMYDIDDYLERKAESITIEEFKDNDNEDE